MKSVQSETELLNLAQKVHEEDIAQGLSEYFRAQTLLCAADKTLLVRKLIDDALRHYQEQRRIQAAWKSVQKLQIRERPLILMHEQCVQGVFLSDIADIAHTCDLCILHSSSEESRMFSQFDSVVQTLVQTASFPFSQAAVIQEELRSLTPHEILHSLALLAYPSFSWRSFSYLPLKPMYLALKQVPARLLVDNSLSAAYTYKALAKHADYLLEDYRDEFCVQQRYCCLASRHAWYELEFEQYSASCKTLYSCMKHELMVLKEAQDNAETLARYLAAHPAILLLRSPHHPEDPGFELCAQHYEHKGGRCIYFVLKDGYETAALREQFKSHGLAYTDLTAQGADRLYEELLCAKARAYTQVIQLNPGLTACPAEQDLPPLHSAYLLLVGAEHIQDLLELFEEALRASGVNIEPGV